jgi:hypothetical protein
MRNVPDRELAPWEVPITFRSQGGLPGPDLWWQ